MPFLSGYSELFNDKELSVISATLELGDELPHIPLVLIKTKYEARKHLIETIYVSCVSETMSSRLSTIHVGECAPTDGSDFAACTVN